MGSVGEMGTSLQRDGRRGKRMVKRETYRDTGGGEVVVQLSLHGKCLEQSLSEDRCTIVV